MKNTDVEPKKENLSDVFDRITNLSSIDMENIEIMIKEDPKKSNGTPVSLLKKPEGKEGIFNDVLSIDQVIIENKKTKLLGVKINTLGFTLLCTILSLFLYLAYN